MMPFIFNSLRYKPDADFSLPTHCGRPKFIKSNSSSTLITYNSLLSYDLSNSSPSQHSQMNHNYFIKPFSSLIILFVTTILLVSPKASCTDSYFLACSNTTSCGIGPNISFPFYIQGLQNSSCGHPGFEISCKNDRPIIRISNNDYIIHQIFYKNHTLQVSNAAVVNNCENIPPIQNLSLPLDKFDLSPISDLFILYKCNSTLVNRSDLWKYKVDCSSNGTSETNYTTIAIHEDDPSLNGASESCENRLEVPIQEESNRRDEWVNRTLEQILQKGFALNWKATNCDECRDSGGKCGFNETLYSFRCFCPDRPHRVRCNSSGNDIGQKIGLGVGVPVAIIILLSLYTFRRYYKKKKSDFDLTKSQSDPSSQAELEEGSIYYGVPVFSYSELEEATNNFDTEKELGDGGFGTVYYGKLRDGREVAVKRLYEHNYRRLEQFVNEIKILTRLHHKNLVTLYGCTSRRSRELLLVYEYIPNGTVADHLNGDRANSDPLAWPLRLRIAIETAAALAYLHASDIIHRDVKTNNILLDNNFVVKVADFGISRLFPSDATHVSTAPQGTPGYVDPEYHQCYQLTDKSDVYSYGVVLIELISSMPAVDISRHRHEINLANLAVNKIQNCALDELVDQQLGYGSDEEVRRTTTSVAELAFRCLQQDKELRPTMDEVLAELKRIESGENEEAKVQQKVDGILRQQSLPPLSPPYSDEAVLLKNVRLPPSPISVAERWISSDSTTPNVSC